MRKNGVVLEKYLDERLVPIPGGSEVMRHFSDEQKWISSDYRMSIPGRKKHLKETCREIEIKPFYLLQIPVTADLYAFVMGEGIALPGDGLPAVNVSWLEANDFCRALSEAAGLCFRLPTEAEWQHACRAGGGGYQYGEIDDIAWHQGNSNGMPHKTGEKAPNPWGVYDMLGNVWEWCWDLYDEKRYGPYRAFRGGSWAEPARSCGATCRRRSFPSFKIDDLGFRIARSGDAP